MPLSKVDSRGKYGNRITDEDPNNGGRGKLNASQMEERIDLHAKHKLYGRPTYAQIALHWFEKYQIQMHHQTEQDWGHRESNKIAIDRRADEMLKSGEGQIASVSDQALVNSLAIGAKENAKILGLTGATIKDLLCELKGSEDNKVRAELASLLKSLTGVSKTHSEKLTDMIKLATDVNKNGSLKEDEIRRQARMIATGEAAKAAGDAETKKISEVMDIDEIIAGRELIEGEHGIN